MFVVFDLDGTLADNAHRLHHIRKEPRDYAAYHAACANDGVISPVLRTLDAHLIAGHEVEIWTGRSDAVRDMTELWLRRAGIHPGVIGRMRPAGDRRPNAVLKREWLLAARMAGRAPDIVYDDMPDAVAMWRAEGVACFQVAPGDKA